MKASEHSKIRLHTMRYFFKIFIRYLPSMVTYLLIFLIMVVLFVNYGVTPAANFEESKAKVAFFDYDGTPLTNGLKSSLAKNADFVDIKDDSSALQDALYFRSAEYIVKIPKGFTDSFLNGGGMRIDKTTVPDSQAAIYMDFVVNRYLNTAGLFQKNTPGISQEKLAQLVKDNLAVNAQVKVNSYGSKANALEPCSRYYTYLVYALLCILILCVSGIMGAFGDSDLRRRIASSPLKPTSFNLQLFAGFIVMTLAVCLCSVLLSIALFGIKIFGTQFVFFCVNLLCFAFAALSLSFLVSGVATSRAAQNGIANVLSLGMCFISGIFIPQEFLSGPVLTAAHFTPSYWYVDAVSQIKSLTVLNTDSLRPILAAMVIQLGFAAAFFAVSLDIRRRRRVF